MIQSASSASSTTAARRHSSCGVASGSRKSTNASTATAMTPSTANGNRRPSAATAAAAAAAGLIVTSVRATGSTPDKQQNSTQQVTSSMAIERRRRRSDCCSTAVTDTTWFIRPIHIIDNPATVESGNVDSFAAESRLLDATSAGVFGTGGKKLTESVEKELVNGSSTPTTSHQRHHLHHSHAYHRQNKSDFKEVGADLSSLSSVQTKGSMTSPSGGIDDLLKAYFPATLLASRLRDTLGIELQESGQLSQTVNGEPSPAPSPPTSLPQAADRLQRSSDLDERENVMATASSGRKTTSAVAVTGAVLENKNPSQSSADRRSSRRTRTPTTPSASAGRSSRPASCRSSSSSASNGSFDRMYLNSSTDTNGLPLTALMSSPYQNDDARWRLDALRMEEKNLLELKRQAELERIRGPQPKWYEMRSSEFHREARRNNELMKNRVSWQRLLDYRQELEIASHQFQSGSDEFIVVDPPPMTTTVRQSTLSTGAGVAGVSGNDARY